jgi:hypothetical protein
VVVHTYNSNVWEAEVGGFQVLGQPGLHNELFLISAHTSEGSFGS